MPIRLSHVSIFFSYIYKSQIFLFLSYILFCSLIFHNFFFLHLLYFVVFFTFPQKKKEKQNLNILGRKLRQTRSGNSSPVQYGPHHTSSSYHHNSVAAMGSPYYRDMDEPQSPAGGGHHRSRSASRPPISHSIDYPSKYNNIYLFYF